MKASYKTIKNEYKNLTIYRGVVKSAYFNKTIWIDRLHKKDAINDALNEIDLINSMSKFPNSQF